MDDAPDCAVPLICPPPEPELIALQAEWLEQLATYAARAWKLCGRD